MVSSQAARSSLLEKLLTVAAMTIAVGLIAGSFNTLQASSAEPPHLPTSYQTLATVLRLPTVPQSRFADGVYLYGQAPVANQLATAYLVFEVSNNQVVGGFYMPQSSFDCFQGELQTQQLALRVVDSYEQTSHPYTVALQTSPDLTAGNLGATAVGLAGYHRLNTISEVDQHILSTCKANA